MRISWVLVGPAAIDEMADQRCGKELIAERPPAGGSGPVVYARFG